MKALILAAGLGTRLLPHTQRLPKPLFTLASMPMLGHVIKQLADSGCDQILINTHHLHDQIESFISKNNFDVDIQLLHEPKILDTGGAIANAKSYLRDAPFFVVNADVISNIDLKRLLAAHNTSDALATLVLHNDKRFNKIAVDDQGYILNFNDPLNGLAFTGVQVLSPEIFDFFPDKIKFSSIDVYKNLCPKNQVRAFIEKKIFWSDIGTPEDYQMTSLLMLCVPEFNLPMGRIKEIEITALAGDGSDRRWYRVAYKDKTNIISAHGICLPRNENFLQLNAFVHIGGHLHSKGIPVPHILSHDTLSGMVILEDLGDLHLETRIKEKGSDAYTLSIYKQVIDHLIRFSTKGFKEFDPDWTCQSQTYSKELILEKECRYFIEAFIKVYLKISAPFDHFIEEFETIADQALEYGHTGLMHRDMQSRNIMIKDEQIYFIDFQSARIGPLQYDLASLLIDPYVNLKDDLKEHLLQYTMGKLDLDQGQCKYFTRSFNYCCLTRNLQFLGAFSYLSQVKNKPGFEQYIPDAVNSLSQIFSSLDTRKFPRLEGLIQTITDAMALKTSND